MGKVGFKRSREHVLMLLSALIILYALHQAIISLIMMSTGSTSMVSSYGAFIFMSLSGFYGVLLVIAVYTVSKIRDRRNYNPSKLPIYILVAAQLVMIIPAILYIFKCIIDMKSDVPPEFYTLYFAIFISVMVGYICMCFIYLISLACTLGMIHYIKQVKAQSPSSSSIGSKISKPDTQQGEARVFN